jgi:hypothetical protein
MSTPKHPKLPLINIGDQIFLHDGDDEFGAVRDVAPDGRPEIIIYIENTGSFTVPLSAITAVHDGKVVVELDKLPVDVQVAVRHAHDSEQF